MTVPITSPAPVVLPVDGIVSVNELVVVKSEVKVNVAFTVALLPRVTVDPVLLIVKPLYAVVLVAVCGVDPLNVTTLLVVVNVPLLVKLPATDNPVPAMLNEPPDRTARLGN